MATYSHIFGPVHSRRFGRSLGVDLQSAGGKRCTLNCIFCQLGPTATTSVTRQPDVAVDDVLAELDRWLQSGGSTDFITLAGTGEPTLHPEFGRVLDWIRTETPYRSLLLSNGTLFTLPEVRRDAARADVVKVSLHAWDTASFRHVTRPHASLAFAAIIDGFRQFRREYAGVLIVEVFIIPGFNDTPEAADRIAAILRDIAPDHIQLNFAARPPAEGSVAAISLPRLQQLARRFTPEAEPPGSSILSPPFLLPPEQVDAIAALVTRHPADLAQLSETFGIHPPEILRPSIQRLAAAGRVAVRWDDHGRLQVQPPRASPAPEQRPVEISSPPPPTAADQYRTGEALSPPPSSSPLILGSASPRRARLLRELVPTFEILPIDAPEVMEDADPAGTVCRNALAKHAACRVQRPNAVIITADTLVWFEGRLVGKPTDLDEAARFLRSFSGKTQTVFTAVAFSRAHDTAPILRIECSRVTFRHLDESLIRDYLSRNHTLDRAGAYDIDENGDLLISGFEGSRSNIAGLPVESVRDWFRHYAPGLLVGG